jgi:hypothetical protein
MEWRRNKKRTPARFGKKFMFNRPVLINPWRDV